MMVDFALEAERKHGRERARGSPSSRAAAVPADHDDHDGRAPSADFLSRWGPDRARSCAGPLRDCHRGRIGRSASCSRLYTTPVIYVFFDRIARKLSAGASRPGAADGARGRRESSMSLSSPFIRPPGGYGPLDGGRRARPAASPFTQLPVLTSSADRFPHHHRGRRRLPGASPENHGVVGRDTARAPVRPHRRGDGDDVHQLSGLEHRHAAVRPGPQASTARRAGTSRPAINAARGYLPANLPSNPTYRKSQSGGTRRS